jgi:hypothetical protein
VTPLVVVPPVVEPPVKKPTPKPPASPRIKHKAKLVKCAFGTRKDAHGCQDLGISAPRHCACNGPLRVVVQAKAGSVVRVSGAGLNLMVRTNARGVAVLKLRPSKKGIVTIRVNKLVKRIGVTCAPQGSQLTG